MPNDTPQDNDAIVRAKYARGILAEEIKFRRDRRQQIFSWASSLLVAIIGGSTVLTSAAKLGQLSEIRMGNLCATTKILGGLYAAIVILGVSSVCWIIHHYDREKALIDASKELDNTPIGIRISLPDAFYKYKEHDYANIAAIILLMVAALFAVYINLASSWPKSP
jgi:hypothetical protein